MLRSRSLRTFASFAIYSSSIFLIVLCPCSCVRAQFATPEKPTKHQGIVCPALSSSRPATPTHPSKEGTRCQKAVIGVCTLEPNHAKHKTVTMGFDQLLSYIRMTCSRSFVKQRVATIHHPSKVPFFQEHHQVMRKPKSAA